MKRLAFSLGILIVLIGAWTLWQRGCQRALPEIAIDGGAIVVRNQTAENWTNVRIWVNDYYSGTVSEIRAGSFLREPVTAFVASQGQRMKTGTLITGVVVLGTTSSGAPLRILWGKSAWH